MTVPILHDLILPLPLPVYKILVSSTYSSDPWRHIVSLSSDVLFPIIKNYDPALFLIYNWSGTHELVSPVLRGSRVTSNSLNRRQCVEHSTLSDLLLGTDMWNTIN